MGCRIWMEPEMDISFLFFLLPGEKVRLRDDVHDEIKIRDWVFAGYGKNGLISLCHGTQDYLWEIKVQEIDWDEYCERQVMKLRPFPHQSKKGYPKYPN